MPFKDINRDQECFLPSSLSDLIPSDDILFSILNITEKIDTTRIELKYDDLGRNAYHPKMMIAIIYYAYTQGIFPSRCIEKALRYDIRFMYAAGMHRPSFNRICQFKRENYTELIDCFVQIVQECCRSGLATLQSISIDGTKLEASASPKKTKSREDVEKELTEIKERIKELVDFGQQADDEKNETDDSNLADIQRQELEARQRQLEEAKAILDADEKQARINFTDLECREQKKIGLGYNAQAAVDPDHQLIIAADVVSAPNDQNQLIPMIEQIERNTDSEGHSKQINADAGYASRRNFIALDEGKNHIDAYIPPQSLAQESMGFDKCCFEFDPVNLTAQCPMNHPMKFLSKEERNGVMTFRFAGTSCSSCPSKSSCTKSSYRVVRFREGDALVNAMSSKMQTSAGSSAMQERRQTVEPVFGIMKHNLGFKRFLHRGLVKVRGEFILLCTALNLRKIHEILCSKGIAGALPQLKGIIPLILSFFAIICKLCKFGVNNIPNRICLACVV